MPSKYLLNAWVSPWAKETTNGQMNGWLERHVRAATLLFCWVDSFLKVGGPSDNGHDLFTCWFQRPCERDMWSDIISQSHQTNLFCLLCGVWSFSVEFQPKFQTQVPEMPEKLNPPLTHFGKLCSSRLSSWLAGSVFLLLSTTDKKGRVGTRWFGLCGVL